MLVRNDTLCQWNKHTGVVWELTWHEKSAIEVWRPWYRVDWEATHRKALPLKGI